MKPDERAIASALATARILSVALALACGMYVLVAALMRQQRQALPADQHAMPTVLLLVMAGMGLIAAPFVRSAMIRRTEARGLSAWFVSVIVAQALREGAAVMGLVVTLLTGRLWPVIACAGVAMAAILRDFPRRADLDEHLRR